MRIFNIAFILIMTFICCQEAFAQRTPYSVKSQLSVFKQSVNEDNQVSIVSRAEKPFVGITGNSSVIIVSGRNHLGNIMMNDNHYENSPINTGEALPGEYKLHSNYPNPFNPSTTVRYYLPNAAHVVVKIYKILGQEVCTLVNDDQAAGDKSVVWSGTNHLGQSVSSGVYICRFQAGDYIKSIKMLLVK